MFYLSSLFHHSFPLSWTHPTDHLFPIVTHRVTTHKSPLTSHHLSLITYYSLLITHHSPPYSLISTTICHVSDDFCQDATLSTRGGASSDPRHRVRHRACHRVRHRVLQRARQTSSFSEVCGYSLSRLRPLEGQGQSSQLSSPKNPGCSLQGH